MNQHHQAEQKSDDHGSSLWRTPTGMSLAVFLGAAGLLLVLEHGAHLAGVAPLLLLLLLCGGMHFFMHHGDGGHGGGENFRDRN